MKAIAIFLAGLAAGALLVVAAHAHRMVRATGTAPPAHAHSEFAFTVHAPMEVAAPLFGAEAERGWEGESWQTRFLFPQPAADIEGAVFAVRHGAHDSIWVATAQDFKGGHVQYVNLIDGAMATCIDIRLRAAGATETAVTVVYERTALHPELHEHVMALAAEDKSSDRHWSDAIDRYLQASSPNTQPKR